MVTITKINPLDPLYFQQFHCDEGILEELTKHDFPWDVLHQRALFPSQENFMPPNQNPIPAMDNFEEGNMANISPTIRIDISVKSRVVEEITIGIAYSLEEITTYKALFQEYHGIFSWSYTEIPSLDPSIVEHHIDT
jgi:hypothetical protein